MDGRIQGRVIDRTAPSHPLPHQVVRLTIVERGSSSVRQTRSDAAGAFEFAGLPVGGVRVFVLGTEFHGVRYDSRQVSLSADTPSRSVDLTVYDPSADRSVVRATAAFAAVEIAPGAVRVSIVQRFENATDRTVIIPPEDPLVFPLPREAEGVTVLAGWRDPRIENGRITDAFPIPPGAAQVTYAYGMEVRRPAAALSWALPYGATDVEVLVADVGVRAEGDGLRALGTIVGPQGRFLRLSGGPVARGGEVVVHLSSLPLAQHRWPGVVAAGLAVVLGVGLALGLRRRQRAEP